MCSYLITATMNNVTSSINKQAAAFNRFPTYILYTLMLLRLTKVRATGFTGVRMGTMAIPDQHMHTRQPQGHITICVQGKSLAFKTVSKLVQYMPLRLVPTYSK